MDKEETLKALFLSANKFRSDCDNAKKEKKKRDIEILQAWASENKRFNIGDIIESRGSIIKIENFRGAYSAYDEVSLYVIYSGTCMTKKLQPRRDGSMLVIYDDGREVKLIKKADVD